MGARTKSRKRALDILFEADQRGLNAQQLLIERLARPATQAPLADYTITLVEGVVRCWSEINEMLSTYSQGWTVERESIPGGAHGYTDPEGRRVVLDSDLSPAQAAKTALHEAAHVILHAEQDAAEYVQHRGVTETEAESVAYVVAGILGLDTSAYSIGYVAGWSNGEPETIKATAANVLRAAHTLADAITEPAEESDAA